MPAPLPPSCALCHAPANLLCFSDDAFLCWSCDSDVHSANFLVARHYRDFLCCRCACPSSFVGSGAVLHPQTRICKNCSAAVTMDTSWGCRSGSSDSECSVVTSDDESDSEALRGKIDMDPLRHNILQEPKAACFLNADSSKNVSAIED